ncbi:RxLR effector protein [Phytophthora megakarya]|uniref:RxLR effector protein n=1 Tax=Phytophthora megakarya TaxID=4795 RepID=A0A225VHA6_9STRA|nr:RxLR effector protein [Phytophthora megakarya]
MRVNYFVIMVATTFVAGINGLSAATSVQVSNNVATNANPTITNELEPERFLKSTKNTIQDDVDNEERGGISSAVNKLKDMAKKIPNKIGDRYHKWVVSYWEKHPNLRAQASI